ncbi:MAG: response regulator [Candidatus Dormibacteraeota bacterium]|nr:response regulator [Candidatus Dormibacteraeota bacterium]
MAATIARPTPRDRSAEDTLEVAFISADRALAELYRLKLELDGYWVTLSSNVNEGLAKIKKRIPDLVFVDLGAGERAQVMDLGALRKDETLREVPVVLLSRRDSDAVEANGFQFGSRDFLVRVDVVPAEQFWADTLESPAATRHI